MVASYLVQVDYESFSDSSYGHGQALKDFFTEVETIPEAAPLVTIEAARRSRNELKVVKLSDWHYSHINSFASVHGLADTFRLSSRTLKVLHLAIPSNQSPDLPATSFHHEQFIFDLLGSLPQLLDLRVVIQPLRSFAPPKFETPCPDFHRPDLPPHVNYEHQSQSKIHCSINQEEGLRILSVVGCPLLLHQPYLRNLLSLRFIPPLFNPHQLHTIQSYSLNLLHLHIELPIPEGFYSASITFQNLEILELYFPRNGKIHEYPNWLRIPATARLVTDHVLSNLPPIRELWVNQLLGAESLGEFGVGLQLLYLMNEDEALRHSKDSDEEQLDTDVEHLRSGLIARSDKQLNPIQSLVTPPGFYLGYFDPVSDLIAVTARETGGSDSWEIC